MSSKYDAVKVQVVVQDDHYYFLSRFLLSKMLMFAKVPPTAAVQISLDLKRSLIVRGKTVVQQEDMECELYNLMCMYGFDQNKTHLFPLIKSFFATRVSLVILLAGVAHCGKSSVAKQLGLILNCSTVVNVETLLGIVDTLTDFEAVDEKGSAHSDGATGPSSSSFTAEEEVWLSACRRVQPSVDNVIEKSIAEGKSLIIEGEALNFALYKTFFTAHFQHERRVIILPLLLYHPLLFAPPLMAPPVSGSEPMGNSAETLLKKECALVHRHLRLLGEHHVQVIPLRRKKSCEDAPSGDNCTCWSIAFSQPDELPSVVNEIHDVVIERILDVLRLTA